MGINIVPKVNGRPRLPDRLRGVKELTPDEIKRIINKYLRIPMGELRSLLINIDKQNDITAFEYIIVNIISNAAMKGEQVKLEFLLNRAGLFMNNQVEIKNSDDKDFDGHDKINIVKVLQKYKKSGENLSIKFNSDKTLKDNKTLTEEKKDAAN